MARAQDAWRGFDARRAALRGAIDAVRQEQGGSGGGGERGSLRELLVVASELAELPDPQHALDVAAAGAARAADLEASAQRLERELGSVRLDDAEVARLAAAHEKEKAEHAAELAALRAAAGSGVEIEAQLAAARGEAAQLKASLSKLRAAHEASQSELCAALARLEQASGNAGTPDLAEAVALDELERAHAQVAALSASRDALQRQVERLTAEREEWQQQWRLDQQEQQQQGQSLPSVQAVERTRARAELEESLAKLRNAEHRASLAASRAEVAESQAARLQAEVERRPTPAQHAEVQAALAALSTLLGQQLEQEGLAPADAKAAVDALCADPAGLHSALQARVARLADALTVAARDADALRSERDAAAVRAVAAAQQLAEAQSAARQLEADLGAALAAGSGGGENLPHAGSAPPPLGATAGSFPAALESSGSNTPSLAAAAAAAVARAEAGGAGGTARDEVGGGGLLPVVARQRDRLAARVAELEEEVQAFKAREGALGARANSLSADNVALVEKLRFLQSRTGGGSGAGGVGRAPMVICVDAAGVPQPPPGEDDAKSARFSCGPLAFGLGGGGQRGRRAAAGPQQAGGGPEARYAAEYERGVNPFAEFRRTELEGRVSGLRLHDRVMFTAGSIIAGSPAARAGVAFYLVILHAYILLVLSSRAACTTSA
ncbi:hypothetical protein Rsub_11965 [Raphidocelis subcapitata]|uniref:CASP C-terminal domain-containing protein n=1 Tax=Raphidocelis subcapitata TaxID=307507 RepID=A0A2V0PI92_9CHLO|nr:hypothetical protein Rsub_11965 [Raphidocelis subcapitata]|eukprot:GBF99531.1 hypothetical protein Rsub_11965 [Raphidocelis subcapitata]